jgi:hypothetical protein
MPYSSHLAADIPQEDNFTLTSGRIFTKKSVSGNNSVVECNLAKVEVAGSNPVSRSSFF